MHSNHHKQRNQTNKIQNKGNPNWLYYIPTFWIKGAQILANTTSALSVRTKGTKWPGHGSLVNLGICNKSLPSDVATYGQGIYSDHGLEIHWGMAGLCILVKPLVIVFYLNHYQHSRSNLVIVYSTPWNKTKTVKFIVIHSVLQLSDQIGTHKLQLSDQCYPKHIIIHYIPTVRAKGPQTH